MKNADEVNEAGVNEEIPRIRSLEDFVDALGNAVEEDLLPGVLGLDDDGKREDGTWHLALLLNDDDETRIPIVIGPAIPTSVDKQN